MEKIRILMADDHPVVRAGIRGMLETQPDFEVIAEAEDGQEAVASARKLKPDVILMDLRMPKMEGVEAIEKIKEKSARNPYSGINHLRHRCRYCPRGGSWCDGLFAQRCAA